MQPTRLPGMTQRGVTGGHGTVSRTPHDATRSTLCVGAFSLTYERSAPGTPLAVLLTMARYASVRKEIDAATVPAADGTLYDRASDPRDVARIASDAAQEGRDGDVAKILAGIPGIQLGKTTYRVAAAGSYGYELVGPRGGSSTLVQNEKNPALWSHVTMAGLRARYSWYKRDAAGLFERVS